MVDKNPSVKMNCRASLLTMDVTYLARFNVIFTETEKLLQFAGIWNDVTSGQTTPRSMLFKARKWSFDCAWFPWICKALVSCNFMLKIETFKAVVATVLRRFKRRFQEKRKVKYCFEGKMPWVDQYSQCKCYWTFGRTFWEE